MTGGRKLVAVTVKEFRQIARDRRTLMILLFVPAFVLLLYGYALNFDIRNVRLALQDNDRSSASRELVSAFLNSGYFELGRRGRPATRRSPGSSTAVTRAPCSSFPRGSAGTPPRAARRACS